jgi:TRAP-type C4-dicarboxylate transport system permease small subunit
MSPSTCSPTSCLHAGPAPCLPSVPSVSALCAPATWDYVRFMAREGTPVLGLPFMAVFFPFVLLFVALIWRGLRGVSTLIDLVRHPKVDGVKAIP